MRKNQYSNIDWNQIPFENLSQVKKRERLFLEAHYKCPRCSFSEKRTDGRHVLEIDHIDGNHKNNVRSNLRVLCPNCHALTPNYKNYNRTNKKSSSRLRPENKSYNTVRELIKKQQDEYEQFFIKEVLISYISNEIVYTKRGWLTQLCKRINDPCHVAVRKRIKRLLPEFYSICNIQTKKRFCEEKHER